MATVIDSLIVTLGLDARAFSKGQKQAAADLLQTRKESERTATDMSRHGQVASEFFVKLRNNALGLFAIFSAGRGIKDFIRDITLGDARLGYLSRNIDMSAQKLQAWQFAAGQSGGSADGMTASLTAMTAAQQDFALTGQSSMIPYLNALHISWASGQGQARSASEIYLDLADRFSHMDPARAQAFGRALHMDPGTVQTLMRGRVEIERLQRLVQTLGGVKPGDTERAQQMENALERLRTRLEGVYRSVLRILGPYMLEMMARFERWTLSPEFEIELGKIRDRLKEIPWERIWTDIKAFGTGVDEVVQKLGGWVRVTEVLFALWAVNKVAGLVRNIVSVGAGILSIAVPKIPGTAPVRAGTALATGGRALLGGALTGATAMAGLFAAGIDPRHLLPETLRNRFGTGAPIPGMEPPNLSEIPGRLWNWFQNKIPTREQVSGTNRENQPPHLLPDLENWQQRILRSPDPETQRERVRIQPNEIENILGGIGNWANEQLRRGDEHMSRLRQQPGETFPSALMEMLGLDKPLERAGKWVNQTVNTGAQSMAQTGNQFNQTAMDWIKRQFSFQHYTSPVQQQQERMNTIRRFLDETEHKQGNTGFGFRSEDKERILREFLERHHTEYGMMIPGTSFIPGTPYMPAPNTATGTGGPRTAPINLRNENPRGFDQNANIRAQLIHDEFMKRGYTDAQSWGWAANALHESGGNPAVRPGDSGRSHGMFQWNEARLARYRQMFGRDPEQGNVQENIQFADWEAHHTEARNMQAFLAATDPATAAAALSRDFIRPRDREREMAARAATGRRLAGMPRQTLGLGQQQQDLLTGLPQVSPSSLYVNPNANNNNINSEMNIHNIHINTQATDAPGIARSIGDSLQKHSAVMQFDYGLA